MKVSEDFRIARKVVVILISSVNVRQIKVIVAIAALKTRAISRKGVNKTRCYQRFDESLFPVDVVRASF